MITISVYKSGVLNNDKPYPSFEIQFFNKINIVLGNSGAGKSYFFKSLDFAIRGIDPWSYKCVDSNGNNLGVRTVNGVDILKDVLKTSNTVIILDEDTTQEAREKKILSKLENYNNYFILLDRQLKSKLSININAVFKVKETNFNGEKIIRFVTNTPLYRVNISSNLYNKITHIITEDTASGKTFWQIVLNKLTLIDCNNLGNGGIKQTLIDALNNTSGDILVALDYDRGARTIEDIKEEVKIDKNRIHFIPLESFEEVICNSEFILNRYPQMRDYVINYKDYISCKYKSTGKYFSYLLFAFVRQKPPIDKLSKRNIDHFYSKGMKNFIECFILDCCTYSKEDCKLYYIGDKKQAMLANKFELYRIFINNK